MALNVVSLSAGIQAAFVAGGALPGNPLLIAMSTAFANAIINELKTNAVVTTLGTPPMTVAAAPGAVAGTGKIT